VAAKILKVLHTDDDSIHVMVNCLERFSIEEVIPSRRMLAARVRYHYAPELSVNPELKAYSIAIIATLKELVQINPLYSRRSSSSSTARAWTTPDAWPILPPT